MRRRRGQALLETLLCLPLFALLLAATVEFGKYYLVKMEVAALCRELAVLRTRVDRPSGQILGGASTAASFGDTAALGAARYLASQTRRLNPSQLRLSIEPVLGKTLNGLMDAGPARELLGVFARQMMGEKVTVRYHVAPRGLPGRLFPRGYTIEESLVVLSDDWSSPGEKLYQFIQSIEG